MQPHDVAAVLVAASLLAGAEATADAPSAEPTPAAKSGRMTFPGVTVERAAPTVAAPAATPSARLYVDPATGRIRERTQEDAAAEAASSSRSPPAVAAPELVQGPDGIVGVRLDSKAAVYSIVTRTDDGRLVGRCVDESATAGSVHSATPIATPTGGGSKPLSQATPGPNAAATGTATDER